MVTFSEPMPAAVMRRLAEAADGYRNGEPMYFLLKPGDLLMVYAAHSVAEAEQIVAEKELHGYELYGPFITPPDLHPLPRMVEVVVRYADAPDKVYHEGEVDALFFTKSAIDKFAMTYYVKMLGIEEVCSSLNRRGMDLVNHDPSSRPCT